MTPNDRMHLRSLVREFRQTIPTEPKIDATIRLMQRDLRLFVEAAEIFFSDTDNGERKCLT